MPDRRLPGGPVEVREVKLRDQKPPGSRIRHCPVGDDTVFVATGEGGHRVRDYELEIFRMELRIPVDHDC